MAKKPITEENALMRLEALCARSERCRHEAREKLRGWGIVGVPAEEIIKQLVKTRFIDDSRFARAFVNDKLKFSGYGRMKIRLLLVSKRVESSIISEALSEIDEDEYQEVLERIVALKGGRIEDVDTFEGRTKLYRYVMSRGFESDLAARTVKEYCKRLRE